MDQKKLYETRYMQVYSYVMTLCKNKKKAEEITQETFFKAITAGEKASFRDEANELTWLCSIAKNIYRDEVRKQKRFGEMPEDIVSGDDIESQTVDKEMSFQIHVALHNLEEPYKEVFQLRVFGELSFASIGKLFGKTENWARVTYHRAKVKIQERMRCDE